MNLEDKKKEILDTFKDLSFREDTHQYFLGDRNLKYSVSGIIKKYSNPFNTDQIAPFSAKKAGVTVKEIKRRWDYERVKSVKIGNAAHLFGEYFMFDRSLVPQTGYDAAIVKFWTELPDFIIPVFPELRAYHKKKFYAGTMDILLYNTLNDTFMIGDYKSNKDLFKNHQGQMLRGRFSDLLDTPFNKYQIQLNYYQQLVEQVPGVKISKRKIIWLKPDGNYELYECKDFSDRLNKKLILQ